MKSKITEILENTTEEVHKKAHIKTWNFIIEELVDYDKLKENCMIRNTTLTFLKKRSLARLKTFVNKEGTYEEVIKHILNRENNLENYCWCWACRFAYNKSKNNNEEYIDRCDVCPLLKVSGGNLEVPCMYSTSTFNEMAELVRIGLYKKAIELAKIIRDAWREVK